MTVLVTFLQHYQPTHAHAYTHIYTMHMHD